MNRPFLRMFVMKTLPTGHTTDVKHPFDIASEINRKFRNRKGSPPRPGVASIMIPEKGEGRAGALAVCCQPNTRRDARSQNVPLACWWFRCLGQRVTIWSDTGTASIHLSLSGSSMMIRSPPRPVRVPPTEVARSSARQPSSASSTVMAVCQLAYSEFDDRSYGNEFGTGKPGSLRLINSCNSLKVGLAPGTASGEL
jgi:hypothetical protein